MPAAVSAGSALCAVGAGCALWVPCCGRSRPLRGSLRCSTAATRWVSASPFSLPRRGLCLLKQQVYMCWGSQNLEEEKVFMAAPLAHSHTCCLPGLQLAAVRSCLLQGQINSLLGRGEGVAGCMTSRRWIWFLSPDVARCPQSHTLGCTVATQVPGSGHSRRGETASSGEHWKKAFGLYLSSLSREQLSLKMSDDTVVNEAGTRMEQRKRHLVYRF